MTKRIKRSPKCFQLLPKLLNYRIFKSNPLLLCSHHRTESLHDECTSKRNQVHIDETITNHPTTMFLTPTSFVDSNSINGLINPVIIRTMPLQGSNYVCLLHPSIIHEHISYLASETMQEMRIAR
jgi:hypothetical protein